MKKRLLIFVGLVILVSCNDKPLPSATEENIYNSYQEEEIPEEEVQKPKEPLKFTLTKLHLFF